MTSPATNTAAILMIVGLLSGLGCVRSGGSRDVAPREKPRLTLPMVIEEMAAAPSVERDGVTVHYPAGLARQAECLAALVAKQRSAVTDLGLPIEPINVYLKFIDEAAPLEYLGLLLDESNGAYRMGLPVHPDTTSCGDIVAPNPYFPGIVFHELVELSLVLPRPRRRLLVDNRRKTFFGGTRDEFAYTRWFREGFASYAGLLAVRIARSDDCLREKGALPGMSGIDMSHQAPLTCLAKIGKKLFVWDQYQDCALDGELPRNSPERRALLYETVEYYSAAMGVFVLIEDEFGAGAIRAIVQKVWELKNGTGDDIKKIVNEVLGTDIEDYVGALRMPKTGLDLIDAYPPTAKPGHDVMEGMWVADAGDGLGRQAGIENEDMIVSLDGERTVTCVDFELALYHRLHQPSVSIGLHREGSGFLTVEMSLGE